MHRIVVAALALALLLPAAAQAGPQFKVGEGNEPHIVMAPDGTTARAVWVDDVAAKIHYCTIPRGAGACSMEKVLSLNPAVSSTDSNYVINGPGDTVYIAMAHFANGKTFLYRSTNGGTTWDDQPVVYSNGGGTDSMEPILNAAGDELIFPSTNTDRTVYSAKVNLSEAPQSAVANLDENGVLDLRDLQVARTDGAGLVAVAHNGKTSVFFRLMGGDPTNAANWSPATTIGEGDDVRLTSAGTAPWMMGTAGPIGGQRVELRRWTGSAFGAPRVLANEKGVVNDIAATGSAVGAIWRNDGPSANRLRFGVSTDGGVTFGVSTIAREDSVMASMDLALGGDGKGFASFEGSGDTGTGAKSFIKVASTDTVAEPSTTPTPTATPTPTPTPVPVTPKATPVSTSTSALAVGRRVTGRVAGATISVGLPKGCIPAGRPFVATLSFKKQRRKGSRFVKVTRTDFFVGSRRLKIDRKAPFRQTLRIPNPRRGQRHSFRARAFIKVRRGKAPKKSIRATLKVCG